MTSVAALQLEERRRRLALVADEPVRVVLEHGHSVRRRELDDAPAPLGRERAAARVLEGRDRVEEARLARGELALERVRVETFVVHRDATTSAPRRARIFSGRS